MANQITIDILANTRNLVSGVNNVNGQLNTLNNTATRVTGVFRGLLGTLGLSIGVNALTGWVKDAAAEEAEFKRLANNFGKDTDRLVQDINSLSSEFKVDDGAIASYFNTLAGKVQVGNNDVLKGIVEASLSASAKFGQPAENYVNAWIKVLKDGKIKASELGVLGGALRSKEDQKAFNELTTTADKITFIQDKITGGLDTDALIGPWQELTYELDQLKEAVGEELLGPLQTLLDIIFPENEEGERSLAWWVDDLTRALVVLWAAVKIISIITWIKDLKKEMKNLPKWVIAAANPLKKITIFALIFAGIFALLPEEVQEDIKKAMKKIGEKIEEEIKKIPLVKAFLDRYEDIKKAWIAADWAKLGDEAMKLIIMGVIPLPEELKTGMLKTYEAIKKAWNEKDWKALGFGIPKKILLGIIDWATPDNLKDTWTKTYNELKKNWAAKDWAALGGDVVKGIVKGLLPKPLETAVEFLARAAKSAWAKVTQSKSPSRVFIEYGKNLVEGLAIGIEKSKSLAGAAIDDLSDVVNKPIGSLSYAGGVAGTSRGSMNNYITINAGVGTDPYELGRVVRAALKKYDGVNG